MDFIDALIQVQAFFSAILFTYDALYILCVCQLLCCYIWLGIFPLLCVFPFIYNCRFSGIFYYCQSKRSLLLKTMSWKILLVLIVSCVLMLREKLTGTDWALVTTDDGKNYYYNTKTKVWLNSIKWCYLSRSLLLLSICPISEFLKVV